MKDKFKLKVHDSVEMIRSFADDKNPMLTAIMPLLNIGLKGLEKTANEKPEDLYSWLLITKAHIDEAIKLYDEDKE